MEIWYRDGDGRLWYVTEVTETQIPKQCFEGWREDGVRVRVHRNSLIQIDKDGEKEKVT